VEGEDGAKSVTGGSGLKGTQTYPGHFGTSVAFLFARYRPALVQAHAAFLGQPVGEFTSDDLLASGDAWDDANLAPVMTSLMKLVSERY